MISKKVLGPALAGTGAVGATGALAWTLGLFDGEGLGDVVEVEEKKDVAVESEPKAEVDEGAKATKEIAQSTSSGKAVAPPNDPRGQIATSGRQTIADEEMTGAAAVSTYFSSQEATDSDRNAINSTLAWKVEWTSGILTSLWIRAEDDSFTWGCRLKPISIKAIDTTNDSEFVRQGGDLIDAIKKNNTYREKFVENCSRSRGGEKSSSMGADGEIELETEKVGGKIKFKESDGYFQKLWTQDFTGLYKLSKDDEKLVEEIAGWSVEEIKEEEGRVGKVKISHKNKGWFCSISGNYSGNLGGRKFKEEFSDEILDLNSNNGYENEIEKKKYLIRNCAKNQKDIKGLIIQTTGNNKWEFRDLQKILEGMYTNPTTLS